MRTFADQEQQLSDSFTFLIGADRIGRLAKEAVASAYRDIAAKGEWSYLRKRTQINLNASYTTGTIAFTAATRVLTLTGGTWPANAAVGEVLINRNVYVVESVVDSTHLKLLAGRCPVVDIASGTSYALVQTRYLLPTDFTALRGIVETERLWRLQYLSPEDMLKYSQWWFTPTNSWYYTILGGNPNGRMYLQMSPPPSEARTYDLVYQGRPRLRTLNKEYSLGTVAVTADSKTVTVTDGVLPNGLSSGCIFRIGGETVDLPTGLVGDNPYVEEHIVASRTSDTVFELQDAVVTSGSGLSYTLDDPIDIDEMSMATGFSLLCQARLLWLHPGASLVDRIEADKQSTYAIREGLSADSRLVPIERDVGSGIGLGEALFFSANVHP